MSTYGRIVISDNYVFVRFGNLQNRTHSNTVLDQFNQAFPVKLWHPTRRAWELTKYFVNKVFKHMHDLVNNGCMKKQHVQLTEAARTQLKAFVAKGKVLVRPLKRALALLALDRGESVTAVAEHLGITPNTVVAWRDRYLESGLADKPRSDRPPCISREQRAKITALACSEAPTGHARWDLRLLAEKVVELEYCETISHTQVGKILNKTK